MPFNEWFQLSMWPKQWKFVFPWLNWNFQQYLRLFVARHTHTPRKLHSYSILLYADLYIIFFNIERHSLVLFLLITTVLDGKTVCSKIMPFYLQPLNCVSIEHYRCLPCEMLYFGSKWAPHKAKGLFLNLKFRTIKIPSKILLKLKLRRHCSLVTSRCVDKSFLVLLFPTIHLHSTTYLLFISIIRNQTLY